MVTVTIIASSVSYVDLNISLELYALVLTISWGLVIVSSPVSATNILIMSILNLNVLKIIKLNIKFVFLMIVISTLVISLLNLL